MSDRGERWENLPIVCDVCGCKEEKFNTINEWGCSFPRPVEAMFCERCEEKIAEELETAIWQATPEHFREALNTAIGDFCVSDRETDMIDVLWNLGDSIKDPNHEDNMTYLFSPYWNKEDYESRKDGESLILPTPEEFVKIVQAFIDNLHPKSPRVAYTKEHKTEDAMTWNFVKQLFEEVDQ